MKTRRRNYSVDLPTVNRQIKQVKTSEKEGENVLPIPIDLVFEIFSRLPVKSIARCRCVSKIWASMLRRTEFTKLFLSKSYARPQLLLACHYGSKLLIFTSLQPQNPNENSPPIIANYQTGFSFDADCKISGVVNGLVFLKIYKHISRGRTKTVPVICNPSTGPLKKVKTSRAVVRSMFGYDPIDKRFKILSMTRGRSGVQEHQVLTIGTDKLRMVECCIPGRHRYTNKELCISGVLYYHLCVVGVTSTNEIVFEPIFLSYPWYIFYLNTDKNTIVRVEIQGLGYGIGIFIMNHVEDVKLF